MDRVAAAFEAVPRADFLPHRERRRASYDGPLAIGYGQTNSQPRTVDDMLRLLEVRPGDRVLDVGAGSGWSTALLAHLTGITGSVRGVELEPELAVWGADNLRRAKVPWASLEPSIPGVLGLPDHAPYDRILVSAEADDLPGDAGRPAHRRRPDGDPGRRPDGARRTRGSTRPRSTEHGYYRFVPLRRD